MSNKDIHFFCVIKSKKGRNMAKFVKYPNLAAEMARRGETTKDLEVLLGIDRSQAYRKLHGQAKWTLGDAEILYKHYKMDIYKLFKSNEREVKKNEKKNI